MGKGGEDCLPEMTFNELIFNFKWNFSKHCNNLVSKPHCLSNRHLWISWWNSLWGIVRYEYVTERMWHLPKTGRFLLETQLCFLPLRLIHCCKATFPDPTLDNNLATMTARANQQDTAWKPSNHSWHVQGVLISCYSFWSLTVTMAPTWATLGTSGSFLSCFQQVGSFPVCP